MTEKELLRKLKQIVGYARSLPLPEPAKEDFISYCSLQLVIGRNTKFWYYYVDFVRHTFGRSKTKDKQAVRLVSFDMDTLTYDYETEDEIISCIDSQRLASQMLHTLSLKDRSILEFLYFDNLTAREVAKIFCVTESAISIRQRKILEKLKAKFFVEHSNL